MIKTRTLIIILSAALLVSAALSAWFFLGAGGGSVATVYVDGVPVRSIDLAAVTESYSFTVEAVGGVNEITVEPGRIRVSHANCPEGVCVASGWLEKGSVPIVCLPHRLVISLGGPQGADAVSG